MSNLEASDPLRLRDPVASGDRKRGSSDMTALWGALVLVGATVGGYALMRATRDEPAPVPAPTIVSVPETVPRPRPATPKRARVAPAAPAPKATPAVVHHVEPEKKAVDPIAGFDSGEAFDNPASPGRYGQRTSGLLERSTNPAPARPNVPDPSFGRTPR